MRRWVLTGVGLAAAIASGCAADKVERESDDDDDGAGGQATSGAGGQAGEGGSAGGPSVMCTSAADCASLNDACAVGVCENAVCVKKPANEFGACDDGKFCTENDVCQNGACVGGNAKFCPSQDACHVGVCDEDLDTCKNVPGNDGAQCDDGDPCTKAGTCNAGVCAKGQPLDCSLFNGPCTIGVCDPVAGCVAMPANEGGFCDDGKGSPCSVGTCIGGFCTSGPANDGTPCNDNLFCTINDHCESGSCVGEPNTCAPPGDVCMIGTCNEAAKTCIAVPGNDGAGCDDGNFCTSGETCSNGQCVGGIPANEGVMCDDGNGCTAGTTCQAGQCTNATSEITQCIDGDSCCPSGCATDNDCLYWASGVQQNVPPSALTGWTLCWNGIYDGFGPPIQQILQQCDKSKLLLACRPVNQSNFTLLAMAPRNDVLFDCGMLTDCTKQSNGVGWYYSDSWSWGFAPGGLSVNRNSCDFNDGFQVQPHLRMCWHTGAGEMNAGYRCGDNDLNNGFDWERAIYEAD